MILELKDICKDYLQGKMVIPVLKHIDFQMEQGEYVAIMGPSGSGKTTLMNIVGCLDQATSGQLFLDGQDISKCTENEMSDLRLKKIGFVFQNFQLLSRQTALENVELPLTYAGVAKKERRERALQALTRVGLEDRVNFQPNQLSGGQKQRVAIARALVNRPKILLADEPTGALDSTSGEQVMELFQSLNDEGVSVLMITHDSEIAAKAHYPRRYNEKGGAAMKKKWIVAFIAAGVLLLGGVTVYAVKTSSQSTVKVVSVSDMSGGGGWHDNSLSGNITSDVSQNIYLADSQTVKKIYVKEGDTVKVGDDLLTYDMTLENLNLEMKKLEKQGIELNIEKAKREITKLKNTKPSGDNGNENPGSDIPEDPGEEPENPSMEPEEPAEAYQELTAEAEPYMGEGTVEEPYHFLCAADGVILGSFLNRMAEEQCFFVIEVREGDVSNGELLKIWGQKITEDDFQVADTERFQVNLEKETDDSDSQLPEARQPRGTPPPR